MKWDMNVDICAVVVLCLLIILQLSKKYMSVKRSRIFLTMLCFQTVAVVCYIVAKFLMIKEGMAPNLGLRILVDCYYTTQYMVPLLFMHYMVVWSGRSVKERRLSLFLYRLPIVACALGLLWNVATQCVYVWDSEVGFVDTYGVMVLMTAAIYALGYGVIYAVRHVRKLAFGKVTSIAGAILIVILMMILQYGDTEFYYLNFVIAIGLMVLYFVAQNQADMVDNNTQVLNRNMLEELLRNNISNRKQFNLIILALDDFKFVNKTFGVMVGDMILMQVACFLTTVATGGKAYRYGSDQFALEILSEDKSVEKAIERIKERFRHPWIMEDVSTMLSTTISCISYPEDGATMENLIDVIDYSILSAKTSGKGKVVYARNLDLNALRREKAIEKAVEKAILHDTIEVYYQPIFNTERQCYTSAEALVRLRDDMLGNIPPDVFIPIAEKNGTIVRLGTLIFEKVCKFIAAVDLDKTSIEYIEINVSVVQCMQRDFADELVEIMERYHVEPGQINLEVTETAASQSLAILQENIERLHAKGISFALDDYGSGYSTLGYIHQLPFKIIKLDRLMVWDAFDNEKAGITLKFTVGMLKELKVRIVAEGVETDEQKAHLEGIGCDYLQGWYYSKAIPAKEFAELIRQAS